MFINCSFARAFGIAFHSPNRQILIAQSLVLRSKIAAFFVNKELNCPYKSLMFFIVLFILLFLVIILRRLVLMKDIFCIKALNIYFYIKVIIIFYVKN